RYIANKNNPLNIEYQTEKTRTYIVRYIQLYSLSRTSYANS
ncbi:hypothetical protein CFSAN002367_12064, partial [Clostridium botulinum CFSAN002367]